jgi:hypothetical protein
VPQVRQSVPGPKKTGEAHQSFNVRAKRVSMTGQNPDGSSVIPQVKAFENTIFGPRTLGRTWGTRPDSFELCYDTDSFGTDRDLP